jgi:hypothetical protein
MIDGYNVRRSTMWSKFPRGSTDSDAARLSGDDTKTSIKDGEISRSHLASCALRDPVTHTPLNAPNGITSP